ncbi:MAG: Two-component system-Response regulator, receiver domain [Bacteroidetes bacterium]|jgi:CheY-like chemotaxis protein|nr:Two-component system-Response regulator, receiver domain [Bacteroidota bacterium]
MSFHSPLHIILADDDADDRYIFSDALKKSGINATLTTFSHCNELIDHLQNGLLHPDIIFLDINMPKMSGKECLQKIRTDLNQQIPVVMYSTSSNPEDIEETYHAGANLYITKPFTYGLQVAMFGKLFELYRITALKPPSKNDFLFTHANDD